MCQRGGYGHGKGKGTVRKESRWVEEIKRDFGDGKLLFINQGQTNIPQKTEDMQN